MNEPEPPAITAQHAKSSLHAHAAVKGAEIQAKFGPAIGWKELLGILDDRTLVRYPCEIVFDDRELLEGEFAYPAPKGARPEDGFTLFIHPYFASQLDRVPYLALYQLAAVNYGQFAAADDAEVFGANALGIGQEEYYQALCRMADELQPGR